MPVPCQVMRAGRAVGLVFAACAVLVACDASTGGSTAPPSPVPIEASSSPVSSTAPPAWPSAVPLPSPATPSFTTTSPLPVRPGVRPLAGKTVVLDPGHNGANAANLATINTRVPDGRGGFKSCNTTGTSTDGGYPEHAFAWDVAEQVQVVLAEAGAQVVLTRSDDTGVGPCVNQRAKIADDAGADAVVSIHADGAAPGGHGFHIIYSSPPVNPVQAGPGLHLAQVMRDAMITGGFTPSSYIGAEGLNPRADIAGLNLSARPAVLVECANMRNQADAAVLSEPSGRAGYARAITEGIERFLAPQ